MGLIVAKKRSDINMFCATRLSRMASYKVNTILKICSCASCPTYNGSLAPCAVTLDSLWHGDSLTILQHAQMFCCVFSLFDFPVRVWFSDKTMRRSPVMFSKLDSLSYWDSKMLSDFHPGSKICSGLGLSVCWQHVFKCRWTVEKYGGTKVQLVQLGSRLWRICARPPQKACQEYLKT